MLEKATNFLTSIIFAILSTFGLNMGTEQPKFSVIDRVGSDIEIREYAPRVAAETTVDMSGSENPRSEGFRAIAGYIFGANKERKKIDMTTPVEVQSTGSKIAMTAPVELKSSDRQLTMRFFMPAEYKLADLPEPVNPKVRLIEIPNAMVAALVFSGKADDQAISAKSAELIEGLKSSAYKIAGTPIAYLYNPPWTIPFLRRNEVIVPVAK